MPASFSVLILNEPLQCVTIHKGKETFLTARPNVMSKEAADDSVKLCVALSCLAGLRVETVQGTGDELIWFHMTSHHQFARTCCYITRTDKKLLDTARVEAHHFELFSISCLSTESLISS